MTWGHAPPGHPKNMAKFSVFSIFLAGEAEYYFRLLIHSLLSLKFCVDWGGDGHYSSKTDRDTPVRILAKSTKMTPLEFVGTSSQWTFLHISCTHQHLRWKSFTTNFVSTGYDAIYILWRHRPLRQFKKKSIFYGFCPLFPKWPPIAFDCSRHFCRARRCAFTGTYLTPLG